jgi:CSLREA domain-containing protein
MLVDPRTTGLYSSGMVIRTGIALSFFLLPNVALAVDFHVDSTADHHDQTPGNGVCAAVVRPIGPVCTLRAAIEEANALAGNDRIYVPEASYVLSLGQLAITRTVSIFGEGDPVVDADGDSRVFYVSGDSSPSVLFRSLTMTNGNTDNAGGAIRVEAGARVTVTRCRISHNQTQLAGSGIYNLGYLRVYRSSVNDNWNYAQSTGGGFTAIGGGIHNGPGGELHVEESSIVRNSSTRGGGIGNQGRAYIRDSTISGNDAITWGGGIANFFIAGADGAIEIQRSTITENEIVGLGEDANLGGAGIGNEDSVWLYTTIVAGNTYPNLDLTVQWTPDCENFGAGSFSSSGHNLIGIADGCGFSSGDDLIGSEASPLDPELGALLPWTAGGTELHELLPTSPARHAGPRCQLPPIPGTPIPDCWLVDQRGYGRANGSPLEIDIGAWEGDGTAPRARE